MNPDTLKALSRAAQLVSDDEPVEMSVCGPDEPKCTCPCLGCIEGRHCGDGTYIDPGESHDGKEHWFECGYAWDETDDPDDSDEEELWEHEEDWI